MIRMLSTSIAAVSLASFAATADAQQLVQRRDLSYAHALAIVTGAVDACRALGFNSAAVVVVDRGGDTMIAAKDDNARAGGRAPQGLHRAHVCGHHHGVCEGDTDAAVSDCANAAAERHVA